MNTLSWLIYAAEVAGTLKLVGLVGIVVAAMLVFLLPPKGVAIFSEDHRGPGMGIQRGATWIVLSASVFLAVFAPTTRTIYMIAASEAGEAVVQSPDAIEMMGDLKAVIKKRLKEELGEGE